MKYTVKKLVALMMIALTLFAVAMPAQAARAPKAVEYVPEEIRVVGTTMYIYGYFLNKTDRTIGNFTDTSLQIRQNYKMVVEFEFDELKTFSIAPGGKIQYNFTLTNVYGLNSGTFDCALNNIYADCSTSYRWR